MAVGQITKWLPPDGEDGALFKAVHLDGDEEDLEDHEVVEAIQKYQTTGHAARSRRDGPPRKPTTGGGVTGSCELGRASAGPAARATAATRCEKHVACGE